MRIAHVHIHNHRSIRDLSFNTPEMVVLLGPNNHGKSNVLGAIEFALSTSAKVDKDDFFVFRAENDQELWVELTFTNLSEQETRTFTKYIRHDGSIRIRKSAQITATGDIELGYRGYVEESDLWWLRASAYEQLDTLDKVRAEAESVPELASLLEGGGRITRQRLQDWQSAYIQQHRADLTFTEGLEDSPLLGPRNVAGGILPDFYLVPAVRDLSEETKVKTTTTFGRLLQRAIQEMAQHDTRFADLRNSMQQLIEELNARPEDPTQQSRIARLEQDIGVELQAWGVNVSIEVTPPEMEKVFELGTQLHLDDGLKTPAERKGHGLQRAVLFALLRAWARTVRAPAIEGPTSARRASESIIFAIEEPELFLHPHAQRQLAQALRDIASSPDHQVFICSHSTHFVNLAHHHSIAIVIKNNATDGTCLRQCTQDLFGGEDAYDKRNRFHMAYWVNPDRGEMFFARKVVLVEGETEKAVLPFLATRLGCFDPSISIIDCGSKHNLPLYIKVLNAFGLNYIVIHDEDPLPDPIPEDWSDEKRREKRRTYELNDMLTVLVESGLGIVQMLRPDFEQVSGVSTTQGEKKGKALAALDYFSSLADNEIPEGIRSVVIAAFE